MIINLRELPALPSSWRCAREGRVRTESRDVAEDAKFRCRRDRYASNRDCAPGDPPKLLLPAGSRVPKRNRLSSRGSLWPQNLVGRFAFPRSNRLSSGGSLLPQNLVGSFAFPRSNRLSSRGVPVAPELNKYRPPNPRHSKVLLGYSERVASEINYVVCFPAK